jgi:hypothetical protein
MSKKDTNIVVVDDIQLKESIEKYKNLLDESKELEKQTTSISKKIKEIAEDKWIELYNEIGENPGSIVLEAQDEFDGTSASITYTPMNRFKSVTDKNLEEIRSVIGEEYITKEVDHIIDDKIFKKYKDLINNFILNNDEIENEDKLNFIKQVEKFSIKKETMSNLLNLGNVGKIFETISPVFSIKDPIVK